LNFQSDSFSVSEQEIFLYQILRLYWQAYSI